MFTPMPFVGLGFKVDGADFDGTNDFMTRGAGLIGAVDSKLGIISAWARIDGGDGTTRFFLTSSETVGGLAVRLVLSLDTSNRAQIQARDSAQTVNLDIRTVGTGFSASATWKHILASWDMAGGAGGRHLYVNDVSDINVITFTNTAVDYTYADWAVGGSTGGGGGKHNGCFAELYFAPGQYLDFSVEANRRKFISATGKPMSLGATGSVPTGTAPLVYQHLDDGEAVANFATNRGTGGSFSITGTLDTASTSPSD